MAAATEERFKPGMKFVMLSQQNSSPLNQGEIGHVITLQPCIIMCIKRYRNVNEKDEEDVCYSNYSDATLRNLRPMPYSLY